MSRYVLDTSGYSHFKRGDREVVEMIDAAEWLGLPSIVAGELLAGFLTGRRAAENERDLLDFLANPVVEELTVDRAVARIYAEIVVSLREAGTPLPVNDIWIAACAAAAGASVLTYDAHFRQIRRIGAIVLG
ncbi:MAG TPA: PIN domain-containing protein [Thermoanaerobaculia bacterium]|nr:PIN domain-containing protein [Thermoanaerobaculia bacterium]